MKIRRQYLKSKTVKTGHSSEMFNKFQHKHPKFAMVSISISYDHLCMQYWLLLLSAHSDTDIWQIRDVQIHQYYNILCRVLHAKCDDVSVHVQISPFWGSHSADALESRLLGRRIHQHGLCIVTFHWPCTDITHDSSLKLNQVPCHSQLFCMNGHSVSESHKVA